MSWAKLDDRFHESRKVRKAWMTDPASVGLYVMAITYCAGHDTDGLVDIDFIEAKLPKVASRRRTLAVLVDCGLFEHVPSGESRAVVDRDGNEIVLEDRLGGQEAWIVHDYLVYNDSSVQRSTTRAWDRKRKELERDRELVAAIRQRDGNRCRYCGKAVNWRDRRSDSGGTYDHVQPRGDNSLVNVVVACRGCNGRKNGRTPEEAGMPLLPEPGQVRPSPRLDTGQNKPSRRSGIPDPTRPDPTVAPQPPEGGRARDRLRYEGELSSFAAEHFPGIEVGYVEHHARQLRSRGRSPTPEALRPLVEPHRPVEAA